MPVLQEGARFKNIGGFKWQWPAVPRSEVCKCTCYLFANNDMKYDVNKPRAPYFASSTNTGILDCSAKDRPFLDALLVFYFPSQKLEWHIRHDRVSGDLYGVLPLMKGLPVSMVIHIDRNMDKLVLQGRVGFVHSWVLAEDESGTFQHGKRI